MIPDRVGATCATVCFIQSGAIYEVADEKFSGLCCAEGRSPKARRSVSSPSIIHAVTKSAVYIDPPQIVKRNLSIWPCPLSSGRSPCLRLYAKLSHFISCFFCIEFLFVSFFSSELESERHNIVGSLRILFCHTMCISFMCCDAREWRIITRILCILSLVQRHRRFFFLSFCFYFDGGR